MTTASQATSWPAGGDLALGLRHQRARDALTLMRRGDVDLLDLVADHHDEAGDAPVELDDRRVLDPPGRPVAERLERASFGQAVGHVARMGEVPALVPDVGHGGRVVRCRGAASHHGPDSTIER